MTATARQIVTRALRRAQIVASDQTPDPDMMTDGLEVLNDMMFGFNADGIYYAHAALAVDDTVNMPDEQLRFLRNMLVGELADEYGQKLGPLQLQAVVAGRRALQAAYFIPKTVPVDPAVNRRDILIGIYGPWDPLLTDGSNDCLDTE